MKARFQRENEVRIYQIINIGTILPRQCYPLEGRIILIDKEDNNISAIGVFKLNWDVEDIYMECDVNNTYPETQPDNKVTLNTNTYPSIYKYELVAKTELAVGDVKAKNILIDGIAKINSDLEIEMEYSNTKIRATLSPLFNEEGTLCNLNVW